MDGHDMQPQNSVMIEHLYASFCRCVLPVSLCEFLVGLTLERALA